MRKKMYLSFVRILFVLFLFACGQPLNQELDLEQAPTPVPSIESSKSALQLFCEQSSSIDACYSLSILYKANIDSFASTNWFKEKNLCIWTGISCNQENKIERLDLAFCKLSTLPALSFMGLPFLQKLSLSGNYLTNLEANTFVGLSRLTWLSLSCNQIETLKASAFNGLSNLQYLSLAGNKLKSLEVNTFDGLSSLKELEL